MSVVKQFSRCTTCCRVLQPTAREGKKRVEGKGRVGKGERG